MVLKFRTILIVALIAAPAAAQPAATQPTTTQAAQGPSAALAARAIGSLRLSDADVTARLTQQTEHYLVTLDAILEERAVALKQLEDAARPAKPDGEAVARAYAVTRDRFRPLKQAYVRELAHHLHPIQVDRVKDLLTHDALPRFYAMYCEMVPALAPADRGHVMALLVEMRENAMTAVDLGAQEQWQDKYRGIINNYIARQGHDFRTLSRAWDAARRPTTTPAR